MKRFLEFFMGVSVLFGVLSLTPAWAEPGGGRNAVVVTAEGGLAKGSEPADNRFVGQFAMDIGMAEDFGPGAQIAVRATPLTSQFVAAFGACGMGPLSGGPLQGRVAKSYLCLGVPVGVSHSRDDGGVNFLIGLEGKMRYVLGKDVVKPVKFAVVGELSAQYRVASGEDQAGPHGETGLKAMLGGQLILKDMFHVGVSATSESRAFDKLDKNGVTTPDQTRSFNGAMVTVGAVL